MSACTIAKIKPSPAYISDGFGNVVEIHDDDPLIVEAQARQITVSMGSRAAIAIYIMSGLQAKETVIAGTVTQALEIGRKTDEKVLASGMIIDVDHRVDRGFLCGTACLLTDSGKYHLDYQNEFLRVRHDNRSVALTPDIISLIEQDSGMPVTTSVLQYGLRVNLIVLEAPPIWRTPRGMELVGPKIFGYEEIVCE
jgi:DUF917 family protein